MVILLIELRLDARRGIGPWQCSDLEEEDSNVLPGPTPRSVPGSEQRRIPPTRRRCPIGRKDISQVSEAKILGRLFRPSQPAMKPPFPSGCGRLQRLARSALIRHTAQDQILGPEDRVSPSTSMWTLSSRLSSPTLQTRLAHPSGMRRFEKPCYGRRLSTEARMGSRTTSSPSPAASNRLAVAINSAGTSPLYPSRAWYSSQSSALGK
jgi:hypothetical protein